jgi:hypothetical protein
MNHIGIQVTQIEAFARLKPWAQSLNLVDQITLFALKAVI